MPKSGTTHNPPSLTFRQQERDSHLSNIRPESVSHASACLPYFSLSSGDFWISPAMSTSGDNPIASPRRLSVRRVSSFMPPEPVFGHPMNPSGSVTARLIQEPAQFARKLTHLGLRVALYPK